METIQNLWAQFMELYVPLWVPVAVGAGMFLLLIVPLLKARGRWKAKFQEAGVAAAEEGRNLQQKAEKDVAAARDSAQMELAQVRLEAERDVADARKETERIRSEADKKVEEIIRTSELELMAEKERSERALHEERETIKVNEAELSQADEKDLLVRIVMALGGYGTRLDRLEKTMVEIGKRTKYQVGTGFADSVPSSGGKSSTPLLEHLRAELNSVSQKKEG